MADNANMKLRKELAEIRDAKVADIASNAFNRTGQNLGALATVLGAKESGKNIHEKFPIRDKTAGDRLGTWLGDLGTNTAMITAGNKAASALPIATSVTLGALQMPGQSRNIMNAVADLLLTEGLGQGRADNEGREYDTQVADGLANVGGLALDVVNGNANLPKYTAARAASKGFAKFALNDMDKANNNEMYDIVERYLYEEAIKNLAEGRD